MSQKKKKKAVHKMDHFARLKCDLSLPVTVRHKDINKQPEKQQLLKLAMSETEMSVDLQASVSIVLIKF